ncbi:MAG: hypothetical protein ACKOQ9_01430, partial [Verrucomicrobiota bacterium]
LHRMRIFTFLATLLATGSLFAAESFEVDGHKAVIHLEIGKMPLPDERLAVLKPFAFLKTMRLVPAKAPFTPEQQAKIQAVLPQTKIDFK